MSKPQEIRSLNTLRGVAALIVVISHYSNSSKLFDSLLGQGAGQIGVMLFFILSGFLMAYRYLNRPFNAPAVQQFVVARVARVIPLFVLVVVLSWWLLNTSAGDYVYRITDTADLFSHLLLLNGKSVLWTIAPEIHFYVLFIGLWACYQRSRFWFYAGLALVYAGLLFFQLPALTAQWGEFTVNVRLLTVLPFFLAGVLLGQWYVHGCVKPQSALWLGAFGLVILLYPNLHQALFGAPVFYQQAGAVWTLPGDGPGWYHPGVLFVMALVFFCLVFLVPAGHRVLNNPVGDFLGKISYSLYLLHMPVLQWLALDAKQQPLLYWWVYLAVCLAVAALVYGLIEKPARTAIKKIAHKPRKLLNN